MEPVFRTLNPLPTRTLTRCVVCGCSEVRTDEVIDRGLVLLAECARCEHRWTSSRPGPLTLARVRPAPGGLREVDSAA